jgi:hypothetical protein
VDRRLAQLAPSVATATFALMTAAWAATGGVPTPGGTRPQPLAVTALATGPLVVNDHDGSAILSAAAMAPGVTHVGEVTISNAGDAPGVFSLAATAPADAAGSPGGLSAVLDLAVSDVSDVTGAPPTPLYAGKLAAFHGAALGTLTPGAARRYRFEVTYPAGRPAAMDDPYQGASAALDLAWTAVAVQSAPPAPGPAAGPPATPVGAPASPAAAAPATGPTGTTTATPTAGGSTALTVTLTPAAPALVKGRLATWLQSNAPATARVTGTVAFAGERATLRPASVTLAAGKRRLLHVRLPAAAVAPGAKRRLTVRLVVTATGPSRTAVVKRTLRVTAP